MENFVVTQKANEKGKFSDSLQGELIECTIKALLERRHPERLSSVGREDFIYKYVHYDVKQNASPIKYGDNRCIRGSSRVIYATHIAYTMLTDTPAERSAVMDVLNTELFVLDRDEFIAFLRDNNMIKENPSRQQVNIQTMYNYTKKAYHGTKAKRLEAWARAHALDDDILNVIYDRAEALEED